MTLTLAQHLSMAAKVQTLWPEIVLVGTAFLVMILGLSRAEGVRRMTFGISMIGLFAAAGLAGLDLGHGTPLAQFIKVSVTLIGAALLAVAADLPDESGTEPAQARGSGPGGFDPALTTRG